MMVYYHVTKIKMIFLVYLHHHFNPIFWFINRLYIQKWRLKKKKLFKQLLTYSNHLGLLGRDIDFETHDC
jgi:hypothetical protein